MFYVVENMNFKLDPKYSFYRRRRHSSQRAVTVQRVDNAQLEKLSPFSRISTSDKPQEGAGSSSCSELAAGQEARPGVPSIPQDGEGAPVGIQSPEHREGENGAETFLPKQHQGEHPNLQRDP